MHHEPQAVSESELGEAGRCTNSERFRMLERVGGEETMTASYVLSRLKWFTEAWEDVEDDLNSYQVSITKIKSKWADVKVPEIVPRDNDREAKT